jgi:hypothetical protein
VFESFSPCVMFYIVQSGLEVLHVPAGPSRVDLHSVCYTVKGSLLAHCICQVLNGPRSSLSRGCPPCSSYTCTCSKHVCHSNLSGLKGFVFGAPAGRPSLSSGGPTRKLSWQRHAICSHRTSGKHSWTWCPQLLILLDRGLPLPFTTWGQFFHPASPVRQKEHVYPMYCA